MGTGTTMEKLTGCIPCRLKIGVTSLRTRKTRRQVDAALGAHAAILICEDWNNPDSRREYGILQFRVKTSTSRVE
jgi:hypothetical protein